jgi:hypothetical protein
MRESDYVLITALTRVRAARDVLRGLVVDEDLMDLVQHAHLNLDQLESGLTDQVDTMNWVR